MIPVFFAKDFCKLVCICLKVDIYTIYLLCDNKLSVFSCNSGILFLCKKLLRLLLNNLPRLCLIYRKGKWKIHPFLFKLSYFNDTLKDIPCLSKIICFLYHIYICTFQTNIGKSKCTLFLFHLQCNRFLRYLIYIFLYFCLCLFLCHSADRHPLNCHSRIDCVNINILGIIIIKRRPAAC